MNKDEIIRMAKEAGGDDWGIFKDFMPEIERFASLVAAAEREECAKMCDEIYFANYPDAEEWERSEEGEAIRARGQE